VLVATLPKTRPLILRHLGTTDFCWVRIFTPEANLCNTSLITGLALRTRSLSCGSSIASRGSSLSSSRARPTRAADCSRRHASSKRNCSSCAAAGRAVEGVELQITSDGLLMLGDRRLSFAVEFDQPWIKPQLRRAEANQFSGSPGSSLSSGSRHASISLGESPCRRF
jgi:hypothetical protein